MLAQELQGESHLAGARRLVWTGDVGLGVGSVTGQAGTGEMLARLALYTDSGLSAWTGMRGTLNAPECHKVETRPQDRFRASFDYGGVGYRHGYLSVFLGRDGISWGVSRPRGLLFSGPSPSCDMVRLRFKTDRVLFTSLHSQLRRGRDDPWDESVRRFVSAHRLDVRIGKHLTVGFSEVVLYGGSGRTFEPAYLNPLVLFYAEQWNSRFQDNLFLATDFAFLLPGRADVRGEIIIDDLQYEAGSEPHLYGLGLSVDAVSPLRGDVALVGGSYYHIRNEVYGHTVPHNRYTHQGELIGYPDGPDGDRLRLWASVVFPVSLEWKVDYVHRRQGEGRVEDRQEAEGERTPFPSGVVERHHRVGLGLSWRPSHRWALGGRVEYRDIRNPGNVERSADSGFMFEIQAGLNLKLASGRWDR
jgi:hypothetical protein